MNPPKHHVVMHNPQNEPGIRVAAEMLTHAGFGVDHAGTVFEAIEKSARSTTDLLVLSIADLREQRQALARLATLPPGVRPGEVIILREEVDEDAPLQSGRGSNVRVFVRPVHANELLAVVKRLERKLAAQN